MSSLWAMGVILLAAPERTLCDFDRVTLDWRSKFAAHQVVETERDGRPTRILRTPFDLSRPPHYDWVRAVAPDGVDVRLYRFLTVRLRVEGGGSKLILMLLQRVPKSADNPNGERVAPANGHYLLLDFTDWRQLSFPLDAFEDGEVLASAVHEFNFALTASGRDRPGVIEIDDLSLSVEPVGQVVEEVVPFPPADIAVADEAAFFALLDLDRPELGAVRAAVEAGDWQRAKSAWAEHLGRRTAPRWLWSHRDRERIAAVHEQRWGGLKRYVAAADRVLARQFDFLGVGKTLDHDVDWLQGPTEWTHVLSRFHYLKHLGYAWWATGDEKYAEDFAYLIRDWIADNPVPRICSNDRGRRGTVWRTLETGIRGELWFDVMELFMDAPAFDAETKYQMTRSLVEHARHLHRYETAFRPGNWQAVECTGLAAIGIMLPEFHEAASWRERAFTYLVRQMKEDVRPDGAQSEYTPGYHGWVLERFLQVALLCRANGYEVPGLLDRHEKMFEFLMHLARPDRRFPPLGDAGTGGSVAATLGMGALLYDRPDMRYLGVDRPAEDWLWRFGPEAVERYETLPAARPAFDSAMLPHAKYLVMRTGWDAGDRWFLFDAAPWGGGHSHQDRLQVLLWDGRDLLIDPGMCSYDQPLSRELRRSASHNVLLIDGDEQIQSDPTVTAWDLRPEAELAGAEIADAAYRHRRTVLWVKPDCWVVVDHVFGVGEHELTRRFHFPRGEAAADERGAETRFGEGRNVRVETTDGAAVAIVPGPLPLGNVEAAEAPVAVFTNRVTLPTALSCVVTPFTAPADLPAIMVSPADDPLVVRLQLVWSDGRIAHVAVAPERRELGLADPPVVGLAALVREGPHPTRVVFEDGASR